MNYDAVMRSDRTYDEIRYLMKPGDVIAFGGKGRLSGMIKWFTRAPVSHVGIVLRTVRVNASAEGFYNLLIESTSLNGFSGVVITKLSKRLTHYDGNAWWLPLSQATRERMNEDVFFDFLMEQEGKPYDAPQAILSAIDVGGEVFENKMDLGELFCSEMVSAALRASGAIPEYINPSEVTPIELCRWNIFDLSYELIKGNPIEIPGYSTVNLWGRQNP